MSKSQEIPERPLKCSRILSIERSYFEHIVSSPAFKHFFEVDKSTSHRRYYASEVKEFIENQESYLKKFNHDHPGLSAVKFDFVKHELPKKITQFEVYDSRQNKTKWGNKPTIDDIKHAFGVGRYQVREIDPEDPELILGMETYVIEKEETQATPLSGLLDSFGKLQELQTSALKNATNGSENGTSMMLEILMNSQTTMINTLLTAFMNNQQQPISPPDVSGIDTISKTVELLRDLGLFGNNNESGGEVTLKIIETLKELAPQILGGNNLQFPGGAKPQPLVPLQAFESNEYSTDNFKPTGKKATVSEDELEEGLKID